MQFLNIIMQAIEVVLQIAFRRRNIAMSSHALHLTNIKQTQPVRNHRCPNLLNIFNPLVQFLKLKKQAVIDKKTLALNRKQSLRVAVYLILQHLPIPIKIAT